MEELYDDLYDVLAKFTDDNIKAIAHWVASHRPQKNDTIYKSEKIDVFINLCSRIFNSPPLYLGFNWSEIYEYYYCFVENELAERRVPHSRISEAIDRRDATLLMQAIGPLIKNSLNNIIINENPYNTYIENYLKDPEVLISDLIDILTEQYQKRLIKTKQAITKYTDPHRNALSKLVADIERVDSALKKLKNDSNLSIKDRETLSTTLQEKKIELESIKHREIANMQNVKAFIDEIKIAQDRFNKTLLLLEKKKTEASAKKDYLSLINSLDLKIPILDDVFKSLSSELKEDMTNIRNAFFLLNLSVKNDLIKSLEDQTVLTGILGTMGKGVIDRIATTKSCLSAMDEMIYEVDLSFLDCRSR